MHALSFKGFGDLNVARKHSLPGRLSCGFGYQRTGTRKDYWNRKDLRRNCRIVACSSGRNGENQSPSSFLSRSQTYALLKQQLQVAAKSEVVLSFSLSTYGDVVLYCSSCVLPFDIPLEN